MTIDGAVRLCGGVTWALQKEAPVPPMRTWPPSRRAWPGSRSLASGCRRLSSNCPIANHREATLSLELIAKAVIAQRLEAGQDLGAVTPRAGASRDKTDRS